MDGGGELIGWFAGALRRLQPTVPTVSRHESTIGPPSFQVLNHRGPSRTGRSKGNEQTQLRPDGPTPRGNMATVNELTGFGSYPFGHTRWRRVRGLVVTASHRCCQNLDNCNGCITSRNECVYLQNISPHAGMKPSLEEFACVQKIFAAVQR